MRKRPVKTDFLLVLSPGWEPVQPYGLASLKGFLKSNGIHSKIVDLNLRLHEDLCGVSHPTQKEAILEKGVKIVLDEIENSGFDAVAFSVYDPSFENGLYLSSRIRSELGDSIKIIFGGPHVAYIQDEIMDFGHIDVAIVGEGEIPLLKCAQDMSTGKTMASGFYYSRSNGNILPQRKMDVIKDLNTLPPPDYSDINLALYPLPAIVTAMSRGCIRSCAFCGVPNIYSGYRFKSADCFVRELDILSKENDCNLFLITDTLINSNQKLLADVCERIVKDGTEIYWAGEIHPDISKEMAKKMYDAGCRFVYVSPETGSQKIADLMGKKVKIGRAKKTFYNLKAADLTVSAWFIFGFPLETREDMEETFRFITDIETFVDEIIFSPFGLGRHTEIFKNPDRFGIERIEVRPNKMYCYYSPYDDDYTLMNQIRNFIELWDEYSPKPFPTNGIYKDIIDMIQEKMEPTRDLQFLIGPKYEEVQFLYKGYGQEPEDPYSYVELFKDSFKEVYR